MSHSLREPQDPFRPDLPTTLCIRCDLITVTHRTLSTAGMLEHRCLLCDALLDPGGVSLVSYEEALRLGVGLPEDLDRMSQRATSRGCVGLPENRDRMSQQATSRGCIAGDRGPRSGGDAR